MARWRSRVRVAYVLERLHLRFRPPRLSDVERNLVLLNDVMAHSPLAGRYWVWGGVLLGWARQGRLLAHDSDADFAVSRRDMEAFRASIEILERSGFALSRGFVNNAGCVTEFVFVRDYIKFEFFILDEHDGEMHYWTFYPPEKLQMECRIPAVNLSPMRLLDRVWLKPEDHEAHLTAVYGDWRTPRENYWYVDDEKSIVNRSLWTGSLVWAPEIGDLR